MDLKAMEAETVERVIETHTFWDTRMRCRRHGNDHIRLLEMSDRVVAWPHGRRKRIAGFIRDVLVKCTCSDVAPQAIVCGPINKVWSAKPGPRWMRGRRWSRGKVYRRDYS